MGADGGTIPKRCELVKKKKKKEKVEKSYEAATKWRTCQLSQEPLKKPVVSCKLGRLYNKEAILEAKLNKTLSDNQATKHIHSLSDVKELKLTDNKAWKDSGPEKGDVYIDMNETPWICPVTHLPMNGTSAFFVNWICGCVFSEKAKQELKTKTCLGCGGTMEEGKLYKLYPEEELLQYYQQRVADEIALKKQKKTNEAAKSNDKNKSLIAEKRKHNLVNGKEDESAKKTKKQHSNSIQNNPNVPKSVKNLFTTSEEAKRQPTAHWVTHNPLYY